MRMYEPLGGDCISETAKNMVALANETSDAVEAVFNEIRLIANVGDDPVRIATGYSTEMQRRHDEYIKSPEYAESRRKAEEAQRQKDALLKGALSVAPKKMSLKNEAAWNECVEKNRDPYGAAVVQFAETWARIMEVRIAKGESVADCADDACSLADTDGITGFMYGCAASILSRVWQHGEDLRRWHNLKTQIGTEGEKANESGGVLNPAILRIGNND